MLGNETQTIWGKSILYSSAIPLSLHIGCRNIITIGWDLGTGKHFYPKEYGDVDVKYTEEAISTTPQLYEWCKNNNINLKILSKSNPADSRIERLKTIQDI